MNSAVRVSSAIYRLGTNSSANLCKASFPYTKLWSENTSNIHKCNYNYKNYSQTKEHINKDDIANSPAWNHKDEEKSKFNTGLGVAAASTALIVSSALYFKFSKGVKAESGKYYNITPTLNWKD